MMKLRLSLIAFLSLLAGASFANDLAEKTFWEPPINSGVEERMNYVLSNYASLALMQSMTSREFHDKARDVKAILRTTKTSDALRSALISQGMDPLAIISSATNPRLKRKLTKSLCVLTGAARINPSTETILVSSYFDANETQASALTLTLANYLTNLHVSTLRPILFCVSPKARAPHREEALREFHNLTQPQAKHWNPYHVTHHIALDEGKNIAHINFRGNESIEFRLREFGLELLHRGKDRSLESVTASLKTLTESFQWKSTSPYAYFDISTSDMKCDKTLVSAVRPNCSFTLQIRSRSKETLDSLCKTIIQKSLAKLSEWSKKTKRPVKLNFPKNSSVQPYTTTNAGSDIVDAWRASQGESPNPPAYVSAKHIDSEAALSKALSIDAVQLSLLAEDEAATKRSFLYIVKALLALAGIPDEARP